MTEEEIQNLFQDTKELTAKIEQLVSHLEARTEREPREDKRQRFSDGLAVFRTFRHHLFDMTKHLEALLPDLLGVRD